MALKRRIKPTARNKRVKEVFALAATAVAGVAAGTAGLMEGIAISVAHPTPSGIATGLLTEAAGVAAAAGSVYAGDKIASKMDPR